MNADGTNPTRLTALTSPDFDRAPRFSRDGNRIIFSRHVGGSNRLYIMNKDGTGATALPGSALGVDSDPDWR